MSDRAEYWARLVAAWENGGLSQAAFCRQRGVNYGTFAWWKRRLRGKGTTGKVRRRGLREVGRRKSSGRARFVEVVAPKTIPSFGSRPMPVLGMGLSGYEIALNGGRVIRLSRDFDPAVVAQLIAAVESC